MSIPLLIIVKKGEVSPWLARRRSPPPRLRALPLRTRKHFGEVTKCDFTGTIRLIISIFNLVLPYIPGVP